MNALPQALGAWLASPVGQTLLSREKRLVGAALERVFGMHLLQIGAWGDSALLEGARTRRVTVFDPDPSTSPTVCSQSAALSALTASIDAIMLPHTLEWADSPHMVLREVDRVLRPDGHLLILGFNPISLWGLRRMLSLGRFPAHCQRFVPEPRLRDWLQLLSYDIQSRSSHSYGWPWQRAAARPGGRFERWGERFWPVFAGGYLLVAQKRVLPLTPVRPAWRKKLRVVGGLAEPSTRNTA